MEIKKTSHILVDVVRLNVTGLSGSSSEWIEHHVGISNTSLISQMLDLCNDNGEFELGSDKGKVNMVIYDKGYNLNFEEYLKLGRPSKISVQQDTIYSA